MATNQVPALQVDLRYEDYNNNILLSRKRAHDIHLKKVNKVKSEINLA